MRWKTVTLFSAVAVLVGGGIAATRWYPAAQPAPRASNVNAVATVAVKRTDLSTTVTMPGTLGYGVPTSIKAADGTVTWLPAVGAAVTRGHALYRNNDRPVIAFYGNTPLFRKLGTVDMIGRDVRVVVQNLRALGYSTGDQPWLRTSALPIRPGDGVLTTHVMQAIRRWRHDAGLPPGNAIDPAEVAVLPGPVRISQVTAGLGDPATAGVLTVTGSSKEVTVPVRANELGSVHAGLAASVELPGGRKTPGRVTRIDRSAHEPEGSDDPDPATAVVTVTVALADEHAVRNLDAAPVQVSFAGESRNHVLAVPVAALLALREGGHAVQIAGGPLVAVKTGMFAMGMVEVSGKGLVDGTKVVTAS
jgi:peptidoglycan hydrolase-like protein with peptidoglycan-binding domain